MNKSTLWPITVLIFGVLSTPAHALQSTILQAEGTACMGLDHSRNQTEHLAIKEAKRNASENAATDIKSQTLIKDAEVQSDLMRAFAHASVRLIKTVNKEWRKQPDLGDCYFVRIQAEVTPLPEVMKKVEQSTAMDDPTKPLTVRVWSDKPAYRKGERMQLYIKGNKPFYGRIVYRDASGNRLQLLPNPYRKANFFEGGVTYSIPSAKDRFDMEVSPPFGKEQVTVYASTQPAGDGVQVQNAGSVYLVQSSEKEMTVHTRGIKLVSSDASTALSSKPRPAEFSETAVQLTTKP